MNVGHFSYTGGAVAYLLLSLIVLSRGRRKAETAPFMLAAAVTASWLSLLAVQSAVRIVPSPVIWSAEVIHISVWLVFLLRRLNFAFEQEDSRLGYLKYAPCLVYGLSVLLFGYAWIAPYLLDWYPDWSQTELPLLGHIILSVLGLALVELLYRNTRPELRWHIKFLCFALGGLFAYDLYLYSDALLFRTIDPELWAARGAVTALLMPLLAISVIRDRDWSLGLLISRNVVYHSATLLGSGAYLVLMSAAGYYIRSFGGEWGMFWQLVFLAGAFLLLILLLVSGQIRAYIRVFLSKNFFSYRYDYRREWLDMIETLSEHDSCVPLVERVIMALAQLVESPGGILWIRDDSGAWAWRGCYGMSGESVPKVPMDDVLIGFIEHQGWVVNLDEMEEVPELYSGVSQPEWLGNCKNAWLLVPLFMDDRLFGLVLLTQPRVEIDWNWEVIDLLRTAGRQTASYLALEETANKLAEARQFEGFNRLSAFVIHDLKNLIAQLSLVVRNAERHSGNPEFMQDAMKTVDHAVNKMSRLMSQLKNAGLGGTNQVVDINEILVRVSDERGHQPPHPEYVPVTTPTQTMAHRDRLASAFEHVVHNAQDAAGKNGQVTIRLQSSENQAIVEVADNGCGMTADFIRDRLFKPFETTKGLTGMGIGAYESREYIHSLGGDVQVESEPGQGTRFRFTIPLRQTEVTEADMEEKVVTI